MENRAGRMEIGTSRPLGGARGGTVTGFTEDELLATALGILNLGQRPKVRLFVRFDKFDRYVSALLFVPRERYNAQVRENVHAILARAFNGRLIGSEIIFCIASSPTARLNIQCR